MKELKTFCEWLKENHKNDQTAEFILGDPDFPKEMKTLLAGLEYLQENGNETDHQVALIYFYADYIDFKTSQL